MLKRFPKFTLLALLLLFLNAQQAVAVHAAEHNFHKHVSSCEVFIAAHSEQALTQHIVLPVVSPQHFEQSFFLPLSVQAARLAPFHARAPPAVFAF